MDGMLPISAPQSCQPVPPCGLLNLKKPSGMTSRQVVNIVERLARPAKAGHAGTLDPLATGVLVVCVGGATRFIAYVQRMRKRYTATFLLGRQSPTEDMEGEVVELRGAPVPSREQIEAAARRFVGRIEQRPPAFSALKICGRPAYKLARRGETVALAPRPVEIYRIEVQSYRYPELVLDVECGGGTYIRSLGRDLGESLGTAAVMSALVRTAIGRFSVHEAVSPQELTPDSWRTFLRPPLEAIDLPRVELSVAEATRIRNGLTIVLKREDEPPAASPGPQEMPAELAAIDPAGQLIGILGPVAGGQWRAMRNLPTGQ
jgi:tRNA pseudouridine55 synthase